MPSSSPRPTQQKKKLQQSKKRRISKKKKKSKMIRKIYLRRGLAVLGAVIVLIFAGVLVSRLTHTAQKAVAAAKAKRDADLVEMEASTDASRQLKELAELGSSFSPQCTDNTKPSNMIAQTGICVNGEELADESTYTSNGKISFEIGKAYTEAEGVITFRGNNFRDDPTYGHANITENILEPIWSADTGSLSYGNATWTGSGWTGQPLIIKWPQKTKANMKAWMKGEIDAEGISLHRQMTGCGNRRIGGW